MKNLIGILLLLGLLVLAYFLFVGKNSNQMGQEDLKDFAIEDTASVDQIFMSNKKGKKILLTRRNDKEWKIDGEFKAREDAIFLILKTLHDIKIQAPVSDASFNTEVKRMATNATKVEFYTGGDKPAKVWYVGHPTASKVGTYMILEKDGKKAKRPYITHLLMEKGSLGSRFFIDSVLWRDRAMMRTKPQFIKEISVIHASDTSTSFKIKNLGDSKFSIENLETGEANPLSADLAIPFFKNFKAVYYEYIDAKTPAEKLDSVFGQIPIHEVRIKDQSNKEFVLKAYHLPVLPGQTLKGKPIDFHPERMYAYSSELGRDIHAIVQNLTFDPLIPQYEAFTSSTTVEK